MPFGRNKYELGAFDWAEHSKKNYATMPHVAKQRNIKVGMQELMIEAALTIKHDGHWFISLGEGNNGFAVFERH